MLGAWVGYLLLLASAALFYVLFTGWLGGYLLALVLLLPAASLTVSLPAALSLRFQLSIHPEAEGEDGRFLLELNVRNKLRWLFGCRWKICLAVKKGNGGAKQR